MPELQIEGLEGAEWSYTFDSVGLYDVNLEVHNEFGSVSELFLDALKVVDQPEAMFQSQLADDKVFLVSLEEDIDSVVWDFGNGDILRGKEVTYTFPEEGTYEIQVTVYNACGSALGFLDLVYSSTTSTENEIEERVSVYPNPSEGWFTIEGDHAVEEITVLDLLGRRLVSREVDKSLGMHRIDLSHLGIGVYLMNLRVQNKVITKKVEIVR